MMLVRWMRFTWDLRGVPELPMEIGPHYHVRPATLEDVPACIHVIMTSFSLDAAWNDMLKNMREGMLLRLHELLTLREGNGLVLTHGSRVIGASVFDSSRDSENHLASGPCISIEYRNRGLGVALLHATLKALHEAGLDQAHGITKQNVAACKFVYPKFGSVAALVDYDPQLVHH